MAAFEYKALEKGKQKKGVMEGDNARQVRQRLKEQGLIPVEVIETKSKQQKSASQGLSFKRGISVNDLSLITRQLATLVQAGMPLEESLKAVAEQGEKAHIRSMMMGVRSRVIEGYPLAESFADYPHVFDDLFCSMVAAGEKSGHLDTVLNRLADYAENRQKMRSKLQQAMIYPIMLTLIAIAVISFLLATVVPKIVDQFVQMGQGLPTVTEVLLAASNFVVHWGLLVVVVVIVFIAGVKWLLTKPHLRLAWDKKNLTAPCYW